MEVSPDHAKNIFYTVMAGFGGGLGYVYRQARASRKVKLYYLLMTSALAAFIGFHMILVYQSLGLDDQIIGALNGLTALLGVEFMLYLFNRIILKKVGITIDDDLKQALIDGGWTAPSLDSDTNSPSSEGPTDDSEERTSSAQG